MRVKVQERGEEWDWRSSNALRRFSFFASTSFRAAEIVFIVAIVGNRTEFNGTGFCFGEREREIGPVQLIFFGLLFSLKGNFTFVSFKHYFCELLIRVVETN